MPPSDVERGRRTAGVCGGGAEEMGRRLGRSVGPEMQHASCRVARRSYGTWVCFRALALPPAPSITSYTPRWPPSPFSSFLCQSGCGAWSGPSMPVPLFPPPHPAPPRTSPSFHLPPLPCRPHPPWPPRAWTPGTRRPRAGSGPRPCRTRAGRRGSSARGRRSRWPWAWGSNPTAGGRGGVMREGRGRRK